MPIPPLSNNILCGNDSSKFENNSCTVSPPFLDLHYMRQADLTMGIIYLVLDQKYVVLPLRLVTGRVVSAPFTQDLFNGPFHSSQTASGDVREKSATSVDRHTAQHRSGVCNSLSFLYSNRTSGMGSDGTRSVSWDIEEDVDARRNVSKNIDKAKAVGGGLEEM